MKLKWTGQAKSDVADLLKAGKSAAEIGLHFGVSRSAITGLVCRDQDLGKIGFTRAGKSHNGGKTKRFTDEELVERRRQYNRAYKAKQRAGAIVIPFPASTRPLRANSPQIERTQQIRVVSNNIPMMVEDWLAKHGGPRRFTKDDTTNEVYVIDYLRERGVTVRKTRMSWNSAGGSWVAAVGQGRAKPRRWSEIIKLVDEFRVNEGLQPFGRSALESKMVQRETSR